MEQGYLHTLHAPAEKCSPADIMRQKEYLAAQPLLLQGLDAINTMVIIINKYRQAVFANQAFRQIIKVQEESAFLGSRVGEILHCIHACEAVNGCGTGKACRYCSYVNTILQVIATDVPAYTEGSSIERHRSDKKVNISLHAAPLKTPAETFYVISLLDNSDSVLKRMLERTFFHDIINTLGGLKGLIGLLKTEGNEYLQGEMGFVEGVFNYLLEELETQRNLIDAENNQLQLEYSSEPIVEVLETVRKLYECHEIAVNKEIVLGDQCCEGEITSDLRLLRRVLGNMLKNALEATAPNGTIQLGCRVDEEDKEKLIFWVHNSTYMAPRVQNSMFQRSFSTKGEGRGLGTYSMRLLGEKFLGGKVDFHTSPEEGTTFYIKLSRKTLNDHNKDEGADKQ